MYWPLVIGALGLLLTIVIALLSSTDQEEVVILIKRPTDHPERTLRTEADWATELDLDRDSLEELRRKLRGWS
jgi:hypothetical protein